MLMPPVIMLLEALIETVPPLFMSRTVPALL
jgi:hypothetical protein